MECPTPKVAWGKGGWKADSGGKRISRGFYRRKIPGKERPWGKSTVGQPLQGGGEGDIQLKKRLAPTHAKGCFIQGGATRFRRLRFQNENWGTWIRGKAEIFSSPEIRPICSRVTKSKPDQKRQSETRFESVEGADVIPKKKTGEPGQHLKGGKMVKPTKPLINVIDGPAFATQKLTCNAIGKGLP